MIQLRHANAKDVKAISELEALCFPAAEACTKEGFAKRIDVFGEHFILLEEDGKREFYSLKQYRSSKISNSTDVVDFFYVNFFNFFRCICCMLL